MWRFVFGAILTIGLLAAASRVLAGTSTVRTSFLDGTVQALDTQLDGRPSTLENRLRHFSFGILKSIRRWSVRGWRFLWRTLQRWMGWIPIVVALLLAGAFSSAVDRRLLTLWRDRGARLAYAYAIIGMVVFFRLLREPRVPRSAQLVIVAALVYGVVASDFVADRLVPFGWLDDAAIAGLASRWFVRRCPNDVVEKHAALVRRKCERLLSSAGRAAAAGRASGSEAQ